MSDTAGVAGYEYFRDGEDCERYASMEEAKFESTIRRIDDEKIDLESPEEGIPEFLRERAVFVLPWTDESLRHELPPECRTAFYLPVRDGA